MKEIKNSCNGRGCSVRIVLPNDSKPVVVYSKMFRKRNDIQKVLFVSDIILDKVA